jgi:hypothetical protein
LSIEELDRRYASTDGVERYMRFAALQDLRLRLAGLRYNEATGQAAPDAPRSDPLEATCRDMFPEFAGKTKTGMPTWIESWHGSNTRQLAERSKDPMRRHQYTTLFALLSAYTHAAPTVIAGSFEEITHLRAPFDDIDNYLRREDARLRQLAGLAIAFYLELWHCCSPPVTELPASNVWTWLERLKQEWQPES